LSFWLRKPPAIKSACALVEKDVPRTIAGGTRDDQFTRDVPHPVKNRSAPNKEAARRRPLMM
jgi:hypothetical protein